MPAISMTVNGKPVTADADARTLLVQFLREGLRLTGTHVGCDTSQCGACVVHLDGKAVKACTMFAWQAAGANVTTIEGLAKDGKLHPVQKAFMEHDALQCGFCTPGMILAAFSLLHRFPQPTPEQIIHGMEDNFCRCGAHPRIIEAIQTAAAEMKGAH